MAIENLSEHPRGPETNRDEMYGQKAETYETGPSEPEKPVVGEERKAKFRELAMSAGFVEGRDFLLITKHPSPAAGKGIEHGKEAGSHSQANTDQPHGKTAWQRVRGFLTPTLRGFQSPAGIDLIACSIVLVLVGLVYVHFSPKVSQVQYLRAPDSYKSAELPVGLDSNGSPLTVKFQISIPYFHPRLLGIRGDDCITAFIVDGRAINTKIFGECSPDQEKAVPLEKMFTTGKHSVEVRLEDRSGREGFDLRVSPLDWTQRTLQVLILGLISVWLFLLWRILKLKRWWLFTFLLVGILLRISYFSATQPWVRENDYDGHVDYIQWILDHHSLPRAGDGWEFYQPPLYYSVSAVFGWIGKAVSGTQGAVIWMVQLEGLLTSIAVLAVAAWVGYWLFQKDRSKKYYFLFLALVASWPVLVQTAAKVNNDVFVQLFSILAVGFMVRFWQTGNRFIWYALSASIILGIMTKLNMVFLIPPAYLCLLFTRRLTFEQKLVLGGVTMLAILAFTEWFYVLNYIGQHTNFPIGNSAGLNSGLLVDNGLQNFLGFHPLRYIRSEYLNPFEDLSGRQYFWEYFLKSSFFGEFGYSQSVGARYLARALNASQLFAALLIVIGFVRSLFSGEQRRKTFPLLVTLFFIIFGHLLFRYKSPYSCSEDFRYSIAAIVPMFYYILAGVQALPGILKKISMVWLWIFVVLSVVFTALIPILNL
jgi:hypothetical protein